MTVPALNKIDVTRYRYNDPGLLWLLSCGYTYKVQGDRVYLVRWLN